MAKYSKHNKINNNSENFSGKIVAYREGASPPLVTNLKIPLINVMIDFFS